MKKYFNKNKFMQKQYCKYNNNMQYNLIQLHIIEDKLAGSTKFI